MRITRLICGSLVVGFGSGCTVPPSTADQYAGTPQVVDDSVLVFPSGFRYAPGLQELGYIGHLPTTVGVPFLVLSGFEAEPGEQAEHAVFVLRAGQRVAEQQARTNVFAFPRAAADSDTLAAESRLFIGSCTYGGHSGIVQITTTGDGSGARHVVRASEVHADSLVDVIDDSALPTLQDVLAAIELGNCSEVPRVEW
jgi:hypothetical protein